MVENSIGILSASLPTLRPLYAFLVHGTNAALRKDTTVVATASGSGCVGKRGRSGQGRSDAVAGIEVGVKEVVGFGLEGAGGEGQGLVVWRRG